VELEEQEGLTREYDSRKAKARWLETGIGGNLQVQTELDDGGSDDSHWERGRTTNISGPVDTFSNHSYPRHFLNDSPDGAGDEFNNGHNPQDKKFTLGEESGGWS